LALKPYCFLVVYAAQRHPAQRFEDEFVVKSRRDSRVQIAFGIEHLIDAIGGGTENLLAIAGPICHEIRAILVHRFGSLTQLDRCRSAG
jgi:hypothetical protein